MCRRDPADLFLARFDSFCAADAKTCLSAREKKLRALQQIQCRVWIKEVTQSGLNVSLGQKRRSEPTAGHFQSIPNNGHHQAGPVGPFGATSGLMQSSMQYLHERLCLLQRQGPSDNLPAK